MQPRSRRNNRRGGGWTSRFGFCRRIFASAIPASIRSDWSSRSPNIRANVFLCNMGGIVGAVSHGRGVSLSAASSFRRGAICLAKCLKEAHARKIRVIGRFDLSKTEKPVYDAHPEWFFMRTNGQPHVFNGLYSACINGGVLPRAWDQDSHRGARALRGRWAVLQHVRQPVHRLRRQSDGAVPVRPVQGAI